MGRKLVLVGGGHAHMVTLANLHVFVEKGHEVTVIGPSEHHYYSGMGPGMLGTTYSAADIRFATRQVVEKQGGHFVLDKVTHIEPREKIVHLQAGDSLPYDVLSFNAGSYVPQTPVVGESEDIFSVKPIEKLQQAQKRILELCAAGKRTIGIVGGGPSSAEVAGNILQLVKVRQGHVPRIIIFSRSDFMGRFPDRVRTLAVSSLTGRGVELWEHKRVVKVEQGVITTGDHRETAVDLTVLALGVKPSPIFAESGLPVGPDGGLLVNRFLQCPDYPELFGGGDCIHFADHPLDKVGVYAVRENPILYQNLLTALEGGELQEFDPGGSYLLIFNMGEGIGILRKSWLTFCGKFAFMLKDYIDRRFMKKFQAIEK